MKKNEYVSPEIEIVEMSEQSVLMASDGTLGDRDKNDGVPDED